MRAALAGMVLTLAGTAVAQEAPQTHERIGGDRTAGAPCVAVDVAGHRVGHLECAARRLEQAVRAARDQAEAVRDTTVPAAGSPDVQIGVSSLSGSRLRMGSALGRSVRPERPVAIPVARIGRRR